MTTTNTTVAVPDSVNLLDLARRTAAAMLESWHLEADEESVAYHVEQAIEAGQASAEYPHGSTVKQIWLVAEKAGLKAGVGKTADRLRAEMVVVWNETEPTANEEVTFTTAPKDYDWAQTRTLGVVGKDKRDKEIRKVASPKNRVDAQRGRYSSGLHLAVDEAEWNKLVQYELVTVIG